MKNIVLIDPFLGGHNLTYRQLLAQTLLDLNNRVATFCPDPSELSQWIQEKCNHSAEVFHAIEIQEPKPSFFPFNRNIILSFLRWKYAATAIDRLSFKTGQKPDLVFFGYLDPYLHPYLPPSLIDIIFPYEWSGLYFLPSHLRSQENFLARQMGIFKKQEFVLKSSHCRSIAVLDEGITEKLKIAVRKPVITFPDVTDSCTPDMNFTIATQIRERKRGKKVISLLGSITKRKGVLRFLDITKKLSCEKYLFVLAGQLCKDSFNSKQLNYIEAIFNSYPGNCLFYFHRISEESQFNALVAESDIIFAVYENFKHSSNILTKAAFFRKPVVVSDSHCMGERVQKFRLGLTVKENDISSIIEAIEYLSKDSNLKNLKLDFESYQKLHNQKILSKKFQELLNTI